MWFIVSGYWLPFHDTRLMTRKRETSNKERVTKIEVLHCIVCGNKDNCDITEN